MAAVYNKVNIPVIAETVFVLTDRDRLCPCFIVAGNTPVVFLLPDRVGKHIENPFIIELL